MDRVLAQRNAAGADEPLALLARQQLDGLATLVDQLLHWSVGMSELRRRRVNLARIARQAVEACSLESDGDRLRLAAPERLLVQGDHDHLRSVLENLVRNALAYSPEGSPVLVDVCSRGGMARVSVTDSGPGVSEDEREAIFDPFVRGIAGSGRNGGGLGLFIARRVAEAHGGTVRLQSDGRGSTFHLELPRE
jgi:signal transduction histidine kinase